MEEEKSVPAYVITLSKYDFPIMEQNVTAAETLYRVSVTTVGILLNCVVIFVVSFSRQLHYPRHIYWVAVSIFECLFLIDGALELMAVHYGDQLACRFVVLFYPGDYSILLICLSLAAFDRYLSIVRYEWYKANVTNRGVIILISIVVVVTFVIFTSPFWTGYKSIYTCTANYIHGVWAFTWNLLLGIVCVILHFKIFIETKSLIRQYVPKIRRAPITVKFSNKSSIRQPSINAEEVLLTVPDDNPSITTKGVTPSLLCQEFARHQSGPECDPDSRLPLTSQSANHPDDTEHFPWKLNRSKISRLEVQAALNLSVNILPFWLCNFPVTVLIIINYWCIRNDDTSCDTMILMLNFFWNVFIFHSIYNPVMYMATCSEFRRAITHLAKKLSAKCHFV